LPPDIPTPNAWVKLRFAADTTYSKCGLEEIVITRIQKSSLAYAVNVRGIFEGTDLFYPPSWGLSRDLFPVDSTRAREVTRWLMMGDSRVEARFHARLGPRRHAHGVTVCLDRTDIAEVLPDHSAAREKRVDKIVFAQIMMGTYAGVFAYDMALGTAVVGLMGFVIAPVVGLATLVHGNPPEKYGPTCW
jgi:hypothetical protein